MRVLIVGPQGAGKGTQATLLAQNLQVPHISTGDIFRANATAGTDLGALAKKYMDAGELVPDEVTSAMVEGPAGGIGRRRRVPARRIPAHRPAGAVAGRGAARECSTTSTPCCCWTRPTTC